MKKSNYILALFFAITSLLGNKSYSQTEICLGEDVTVCANMGATVQISVCPDPGGTGTDKIVLEDPTFIDLTDDQFSAPVDMGFPFSFYGNSYNYCVIGSNGLISFNNGLGNAPNFWELLGPPLPTGYFPNAMNAAMLCYQDMNPELGGEIMYETIGDAPNRKFIVLYANVPMFQTSECTYQAAVFYETTNVIEFFIGNKPLAFSWNDGRAIQGIQNSFGSVAHVVPGRNNEQFLAYNDGKRFTPDSPTNTMDYEIDDIPFVYVEKYDSVEIPLQWESTLGSIFPYNDGVLFLDQEYMDSIYAAVGDAPIGYFVSYALDSAQMDSLLNSTNCVVYEGGGAGDLISYVTIKNVIVTSTSTDEVCDGSNGSGTVIPIVGDQPLIYNWFDFPGVNSETVGDIPAGTYQVHVTDMNGCSDFAVITVGNILPEYLSSSTMASCNGGSDGTATAEMTPEIGNVTYQWNDAAQQTTSTAVGLIAGTYECVVSSDQGCTETVTVVVDGGGEIEYTVNSTPDSCNDQDDGTATVVVTPVSGNYTYQWNDSQNQTTATASGLSAGTYECVITDELGCSITASVVVESESGLEMVLDSQENVSCYGANDGSIIVSATEGQAPYVFTWTPNVSTTNEAKDLAAGSYVVQVQDENGCTSQLTVVISQPDLLVASGEAQAANCSAADGSIDVTVTGGSGNYNYAWTPNLANSGQVNGLEAGEYEVIITDDNGCSETLSFTIEQDNTFYTSISPSDITIELGEEVELTLDIDANITVAGITWTPDDGLSCNDCPNPIASPEETTIYIVMVESDSGCTAYDTVTVNVLPPCNVVFIPTMFSPNKNGVNDKFSVLGNCIVELNLVIFNRWGEKVFSSTSQADGWDGKVKGTDAQSGVYMYQVKAVLRDGAVEEQSGSVTLVR